MSKEAKRAKRVIAIGDMHCGHHFGLTPPEYQESQKHPRGRLQSLYWDFFSQEIRRRRPCDLLIVNGDAVDGKGKHTSAREQITTDMFEQVGMAIECVKECKPKQIVMTYGTPYHTGDEDRWEAVLAEMLRKELGIPVKIGPHEAIDVNGVIFDCKHKISGSSIPHGRHTAGARSALWNLIWGKTGQRPEGDIFLRSHVHYCVYEGDPLLYHAMTLPALQGLGDEYGSTQCENLIHFGITYFNVRGKGDWDWHVKILPWSRVPEKVTKV